MTVLDCDTLDSTYVSLCAILGVPRGDLEVWIEHLDSSDIPEGPDGVWMAFCDAFSATVSSGWDTTVFFHLTRAFDPSAYTQVGILPLSRRLEDMLWEQLGGLVSRQVAPADWARFRAQVESKPGSQYAFKTCESDTERGPLGFQIRELAFIAHTVKHWDYLDMPEIVDDICRRAQQLLEIDLASEFRKAAKPCIVKFCVPAAATKYLATAFSSLYARRNPDWWMTTTRSFDSCGSPIPANQVISVESPPDWRRR